MTQFDDKDFILNPINWPCWPLLPVKNKDGKKFATDEFAGLMIDGTPNTVFVTNMFACKTVADVRRAKSVIYENLDDLLKEWRVD